MSKLEALNEEFNNFMHRVTEINKIVKKMNSSDVETQEIATLEAERYLEGGNSSKTVVEKIDEDTVELKYVDDRTVLNRAALSKTDDDDTNRATMSQGKQKRCGYYEIILSMCVSLQKLSWPRYPETRNSVTETNWWEKRNAKRLRNRRRSRFDAAISRKLCVVTTK